MKHRRYVGTCPRCGQTRIYRATEPGKRSSLGDPNLAWWRCDNCGMAYQNSPATHKVKKGNW